MLLNNKVSLFSDMKSSLGVGARLVLSDVVVRLDYAFGAEGSQSMIMVGYPF